MESEPGFDKRAAAKILLMASDCESRERKVTLGELVQIGRAFGLTPVAIVRAASQARVSVAGRIILGATGDFSVALPVTRAVSATELEKAVTSAGGGMGRISGHSGAFVWTGQVHRGDLRVCLEGQNLDITAHRDVASGFIAWLGPGVGAIAATVLHGQFGDPPSAPPLSIVVLGAVCGFAIARAAWSRIVERWQQETAWFAVAFHEEIHGHQSAEEHRGGDTVIAEL